MIRWLVRAPAQFQTPIRRSPLLLAVLALVTPAAADDLLESK